MTTQDSASVTQEQPQVQVGRKESAEPGEASVERGLTLRTLSRQTHSQSLRSSASEHSLMASAGTSQGDGLQGQAAHWPLGRLNWKANDMPDPSQDTQSGDEGGNGFRENRKLTFPRTTSNGARPPHLPGPPGPPQAGGSCRPMPGPGQVLRGLKTTEGRED